MKTGDLDSEKLSIRSSLKKRECFGCQPPARCVGWEPINVCTIDETDIQEHEREREADEAHTQLLFMNAVHELASRAKLVPFSCRTSSGLQSRISEILWRACAGGLEKIMLRHVHKRARRTTG